MTDRQPTVFTIGHSTHSVEEFVDLLKRHDVTVVADVRSAPVSRHNPQFNKDTLEGSLRRHGIGYLFLGRELGARSPDRSCYVNGRVQYARLAQTDSFGRGIERVVQAAEQHRVALMCAEKEPLDCHRTLLVARALAERGLEVFHILADGRLESHVDTMNRLLRRLGLPHEDLLRSHEELVAEALAKQEIKIAYAEKRSVS